MDSVKKLILGLTLLSISFSGCDKLEQVQTPTKTLMQGTWELTQATDTSGKDITSTVAFPVSAIQLTNDNGMVGTQGPMFTYIVYGGSKWISATSKIKQAFDYANFTFNTGEFFIAAGVTDRFTVEAKLQATAAAGGLTDVLSLLGVGNGYLEQIIYHKFIDVKVTFPPKTSSNADDIMIWELDNQTTASYSYKDKNGNLVAWLGWPTTGFTKARFVFTKRVTTLKDIVKAHS